MQNAALPDLAPGLEVSLFDSVIDSGDAAVRCKLAGELARLAANPDTPENERQAIMPFLMKLAFDPDTLVRKAMAEGLARAELLDADLVFAIIANDDDIALPFVAATRAVDCWRLAAILRVGDRARQIQVAKRDFLPDATVEEIARQCDAEVVCALLDNPAAAFSPELMRTLYARFEQAPGIVERLLERPDLPLDIRILHARLISNRIHQLVAERNWLPANDARDLIADASESAIIDMLVVADEPELDAIIGIMTARGMLTASLVLRAACLGEMRVVERALAHLAGIRSARARHMIYVQVSGLKSLVAKTGLPRSCLSLLRAAAAVERESAVQERSLDAESFGRRLIELVMTQPELASPGERGRQLDCVSRFGDDRVRIIARRLKSDLANAA